GVTRLLLQQWEQSVRGCGGDDLERAGFAELPEPAEQIAFALLDKEAPRFREKIEIELAEFSQGQVIPVALSLARREVNQKIDMFEVALLQKLVLQHRGQRRRDRHGELERHGVVDQPLHHLQQRDVRLGYRLEQPFFLQKMFLHRMSDEREMRMEDQREVAGHSNNLEAWQRKLQGGTRCPQRVDGTNTPAAPLLTRSKGAFHLFAGGAHRFDELACALR